MRIIKSVKKSILIFFTIITYQSCTDTFNFKYYSTQNDNNVIYVKGKIDDKYIPNGEFVFYNIDGKKDAKGLYIDGIKSGEWNYYLGSRNATLNWNVFRDSILRFPYLDKWENVKQDGFVFSSIYKTPNDSLIGEIFRVRKHNLFHDGYSNFRDFDDAYRADLRAKNKVYTMHEYTHELKESYADTNMSMFQFIGIDNNENEFAAFFYTNQIENSDEILEFHLITLNEDMELKHRAFMDLITDVYFKDKLLLGKRWGEVN